MMNGEPSAFAKTIQTANIWLKEIGYEIGPDRQRCYHALMAVLHAIRDRLLTDEGAHFAAQLPLIVKGMYFHNWNPGWLSRDRSREGFLEDVERNLGNISPMDPKDACRAVFHVLDHYVSPDELDEVKQSLPKAIRNLWTSPDTRVYSDKPYGRDDERPDDRDMNRGYARSDIYGYGSNNRADADSAADRDFEEDIWNDYGKEDRAAAHYYQSFEYDDTNWRTGRFGV
jgi:uncharacterized protein (DUF2267 family)